MTLPPDRDPQETEEWLEALDSVFEREGIERAHYLVGRLIRRARRKGAHLPYSANTAYINTHPREPGAEESRGSCPRESHSIHPALERHGDGGEGQSHQLGTRGTHLQLCLLRHALRCGLQPLSSMHRATASAATSSTSRATRPRASTLAPFWRGASTEEQLLTTSAARVDGAGLSSYPHPWLMPDFWQFPDGLDGPGAPGRHLSGALHEVPRRSGHGRNQRTQGLGLRGRRGDGRARDPWAPSLWRAASVSTTSSSSINCNLQRLDGPVRGSGKIIQELEAGFRGSGWNVIKVDLGKLLGPPAGPGQDRSGCANAWRRLVDGEYMNYQVRGGAYTREHFFGKYPELRELVANMTDEDIWRLNRGGARSIQGLRGLRRAAVEHEGQPTVILAKTVKGYGMGEAGEGQNITHQQKKMGESALKAFRDRFNIPISDEEIADAPFYKPSDDSPELVYMHERRQALGGYLPARRNDAPPLEIPGLEVFESLLKETGDREISTTMAAVRLLQLLVRDRRSASEWCPSCRMSHAPSAWMGCFDVSASIPPWGSSTSRWIPIRSPTTARTRRGRSCRRESTKLAPSPPSWLRAAPTAIMGST